MGALFIHLGLSCLDKLIKSENAPVFCGVIASQQRATAAPKMAAMAKVTLLHSQNQNAPYSMISLMVKETHQKISHCCRHGAVRNAVGIRCGAFPGNMKV